MAKYPFLSPYNFTGNNPILLIDNDGRDFGVYINPKDQTVIIKATIYTTKDSEVDAQAAANTLKAANGKFTYDFTDSKGVKQSYDIKFEISVNAESLTEVSANNKYSNDESGTSNILRYLDDASFDAQRPDGSDLNGFTYEAIDASVRASRKGTTTSAHEIGHFFGTGHRNKGLFEKGETRKPNETSISKEAVQSILSNSSITKSADNETDKQTEANTRKPHVKESGITDENKGGTVNEKK